MSTSIATTTKAEDLHESKISRYQSLVQKKAALEKSLNEKYEQLHQLCQKEANLIGNNLDLINPSTSVSNLSSQQQQQLVLQQQRNKIHQNEINKLLMEKQKQQQLSQNSLSIINDPMQSKSLRRTHKQAYDVSQQKIEQLNENIHLLTQKQLQQRNENGIMKAQDDIALHRSDNRYVKNALAMVGNNARNLHLLNANSNLNMSERRNSMKSTTSSLGSSNTFIMQSSPSSATSLTSLKILPNNHHSIMTHSPRTPRLDPSVFNQQQQQRFDFEHHKNESPTPSTMSLQQPQMHHNNNINHQIPLCSQSLKNIKINTDYHHNATAQYSPQQQQQQTQFFQARQHAQPQQHSDHNKFIHRLHSFNHQMQHDRNYLHMASNNTINHITDDVRMKHMARQQQQQQASPNHYTVSHSAGLGGYWTINEHNNQRVWISENKFPLSPPPQQQQQQVQQSNHNSMAKKSSSLGNFDFMHKNDDLQQPQADSVSVSSGNSNELKKKEKIWCETSLDSPPGLRKNRPKIESPTPSSYSVTDYINNNTYENTPPSSKTLLNQPIMRHHQKPSSTNNNVNLKPENGYFQNPLANVNNNNNNLDTQAPNLPPKSKLRYSESTRSTATTMSHRDAENNIVNSIVSPIQNNQQMHSPAIQVESPLNVTIIQEGSWKPYKEEVKSYEISDFYKYSEKYRQQQQQQQKSNVN